MRRIRQLNRYPYVNGDPLEYADPDGREAEDFRDTPEFQSSATSRAGRLSAAGSARCLPRRERPAIARASRDHSERDRPATRALPRPDEHERIAKAVHEAHAPERGISLGG